MPYAKNPFQDLRVNPTDVRQSINWYNKQIRTMQNLPGRVDKTIQQQGRLGIEIGGLYIFKYDPKWKHELPYYDTLPMVIPFSWAPGGFLGLNLHYLPYGWRFKLMGALLDQVQDISDPRSRAKVNWRLLNSASKFPGVSPCVKHYLMDHVRSKFYNIPNDQWMAAAMMPVEQFQGATKTTVFSDSRRMI